MLKRILLAIQFHTIIPVRVNGDVSAEDMTGSIPFFPLAGAVQGLVLAASALASAHFFDRYIAAALALAVYMIFSGGFDLDGLADTADALAVKSSGAPEADRLKRLKIMKDSHVGAMGVMALVISILLKFVLISGLIRQPASGTVFPHFFAPLLMMPVFSKWVTIPVMLHGKPARKDGLGRLFIGNTGIKEIIFASFVVSCLYFAAFHSHIGAAPFVSEVLLLLFSLGFLYIAGRAVAGFLSGRFGGLTGDHLGAITEVAEIAFLIIFLLWARFFWGVGTHI